VHLAHHKRLTERAEDTAKSQLGKLTDWFFSRNWRQLAQMTTATRMTTSLAAPVVVPNKTTGAVAMTDHSALLTVRRKSRRCTDSSLPLSSLLLFSLQTDQIGAAPVANSALQMVRRIFCNLWRGSSWG